ncbi:hypothetical protein HDU67_000028 [Dinochytrium kinnereticum]|nr:hypothetical protein HDU67_000028 [Dinochytrium kinnereticum]
MTPVNLHAALPTPMERSPQHFNSSLNISAPTSGVNTPAPVFSAHLIQPVLTTSGSSYANMPAQSYSSGTPSNVVSPTSFSLGMGNGGAAQGMNDHRSLSRHDELSADGMSGSQLMDDPIQSHFFQIHGSNQGYNKYKSYQNQPVRGAYGHLSQADVTNMYSGHSYMSPAAIAMANGFHVERGQRHPYSRHGGLVGGPSDPFEFDYFQEIHRAHQIQQHHHQQQMLNANWPRESEYARSVVADSPSQQQLTALDLLDTTGGKHSQEEMKGGGVPYTNYSNSRKGRTGTYATIIADAILSTAEKKSQLSSIIAYFVSTYPDEFDKSDTRWQNSVRHNLSLQECFVKLSQAPRGSSGRKTEKGCFWTIHPAWLVNGKFQRPGKPRRNRAGLVPVQSMHEDQGHMRHQPHHGGLSVVIQELGGNASRMSHPMTSRNDTSMLTPNGASSFGVNSFGMGQPYDYAHQRFASTHEYRAFHGMNSGMYHRNPIEIERQNWSVSGPTRNSALMEALRAGSGHFTSESNQADMQFSRGSTLSSMQNFCNPSQLPQMTRQHGATALQGMLPPAPPSDGIFRWNGGESSGLKDVMAITTCTGAESGADLGSLAVSNLVERSGGSAKFSVITSGVSTPSILASGNDGAMYGSSAKDDVASLASSPSSRSGTESGKSSNFSSPLSILSNGVNSSTKFGNRQPSSAQSLSGAGSHISPASYTSSSAISSNRDSQQATHPIDKGSDPRDPFCMVHGESSSNLSQNLIKITSADERSAISIPSSPRSSSSSVSRFLALGSTSTLNSPLPSTKPTPSIQPPESLMHGSRTSSDSMPFYGAYTTSQPLTGYTSLRITPHQSPAVSKISMGCSPALNRIAPPTSAGGSPILNKGGSTASGNSSGRESATGSTATTPQNGSTTLPSLKALFPVSMTS